MLVVVMPFVAQHVVALHSRRSLRELYEIVFKLEEDMLRMAEDFTGLNAAVDKVVELINEAITILQNPQTDNNNQSVIDAITLRLNSAADALGAAEPAPAPAPAPATADTSTATADTATDATSTAATAA